MNLFERGIKGVSVRNLNERKHYRSKMNSLDNPRSGQARRFGIPPLKDVFRPLPKKLLYQRVGKDIEGALPNRPENDVRCLLRRYGGADCLELFYQGSRTVRSRRFRRVG